MISQARELRDERGEGEDVDAGLRGGQPVNRVFVDRARADLFFRLNLKAVCKDDDVRVSDGLLAEFGCGEREAFGEARARGGHEPGLEDVCGEALIVRPVLQQLDASAVLDYGDAVAVPES